jgi:hypothetical protein
MAKPIVSFRANADEKKLLADMGAKCGTQTAAIIKGLELLAASLQSKTPAA